MCVFSLLYVIISEVHTGRLCGAVVEGSKVHTVHVLLTVVIID